MYRIRYPRHSAYGAVVRDDLEPVAERLETAAGAVAAVRAQADELRERRRASTVVQLCDRLSHLLLAAACRLEQQRSKQLLLVAFGPQQRHRGPVQVAIVD